MIKKIFKIIIDEHEILINKKDIKGLDLSTLCVNKDGYVMIGNKGERLHRIITQCPDCMEVDHINNNPLDNRRNNLRICTRSQNQMNRGKTRVNTSGYKGVNCEKKRKKKKYRARIQANKESIYLGNFEEAAEAGAAYQKAAKKYHGEFRYREKKNDKTSE